MTDNTDFTWHVVNGKKVKHYRTHVPGSLYRVAEMNAFSYYTSGSPEDLAAELGPVLTIGSVLMFLRHPTEDELNPGLQNPNLWGLFLWEEKKLMVALFKLDPIASDGSDHHIPHNYNEPGPYDDTR